MAEYFPQKPGAVPLLAALAANSFFFHGNLAGLTTGVIPYVRESSSSFEQVRGNNWYIRKGTLTLFPTGLLSGAFYTSAAFFASDPRVQRLSTIAAVSTLAVLPYTALFMLPTNNALAEIEKGGAQAMDGKEEKGLEKVKTWSTQHTVRVALGAVGWVAGIMALELL